MISAGTIGQVLLSQGSSQPIWTSPTTTNTANRLVIRDASGNFAAGTVTANLTGTSSHVAVTNDVSSITSYVTFVTSNSGSNAVKASSSMTYNAATNVLNTTAVNAQYSTTRSNFDGSTRIATTKYVDNMFELSKPESLVVSDPEPNLVTPSAQYRDLINAYLPASNVAVGTTFEFIVNVLYASTSTSVSGSRYISAYLWGSISVAATTTLYDSSTGYKLIYQSNGSTWNYTGTWSYV